MDSMIKDLDKETMLKYPPGEGEGSPVPDEIRGYNFGTWFIPFWYIGNCAYKQLWWWIIPSFIIGICFFMMALDASNQFKNLPLWSFILTIAWGVQILYILYAGTKGNEWAWQNCLWKDVEQFHRIQRGWAIFLAIIVGMFVALILLAILIPTILAGVLGMASVQAH